MTDDTTTTTHQAVLSSGQLGAESIVWVRHNGKPHTSGVAHFGGECPPGWVGGARPFFSAEYLAEAVKRERERGADLADEYNRLIWHMDKGGDFHEFMAAESKRRFGE